MNYSVNLSLADIKYFCEIDEIWKIEEWKDVLGYEGIYKISDLGRVKSLSNNKKRLEKILSAYVSEGGYLGLYLFKKGKRQRFKIHKLVSIVFLGHTPCGYELVINHKNFIRTDNRKVNLEIVTQRVNGNKKHLKSTSKYTGVYWYKKDKKWRAQITVNGKIKHLGNYINEIDASNAYEKELKLIETTFHNKI